MKKGEVSANSPLRVLDQCIHGGLGTGNLGVMVARAGVGKTAFLVDVALDGLMRGRQALHVSLQYPVEKVRAYYDEIFSDLAHKRRLEDVWNLRLEMERNRRIHSFLDGSFSVERFREALAFKKAHTGFAPSLIVMDGFGFGEASPDDLAALKELAGSVEAELWMSAVTHRDAATDASGIPEPVAHLAEVMDVILRMAHDGDHVHISLLKDHDNPSPSTLKLALDPTTMLVIEE